MNYTFSGVSFEAVVLEHELPYEPPMIHLAIEPSSFLYSWKLINFVFELPDPRNFPPLGRNAISEPDLAVLDRFVESARELARSSFIGQKSGITIKDGAGNQTSITRDNFPTREVLVGFAVMFRQLNLANDESSFTKAHALLGKANEDSGDSAVTERRGLLKRWKRAHGQLGATSLLELVGRRLASQGRMHPDDIPRVHELTPSQLIELHFNGDYVHWGDHREELKNFRADPAVADVRELEFMRAIGDLAQVYIGFAELTISALAGHVLRP